MWLWLALITTLLTQRNGQCMNFNLISQLVGHNHHFAYPIPTYGVEVSRTPN